jgi:hypothetical protein
MRPIALTLFVVGLSLTAAQADDWSKTYSLEHSPQLRIDTSDADIRLDTWDQNKIEAHVSTERWKIGEDGIKIIERQTGDAVELEVRFPHRNPVIYGGRSRVLIEVHMPREGRVNLRTGDGRISVNHLKGEMDFYSGDGRLDLDDVQGNLRAHTGDGSIRAAGRFNVVDLTTGDGRVSLRAEPGSHVASAWEVRTSDGSVDLEIPSDLAADLDLHTGDGHITMNFPLTVEGKYSNQNVHGKLNGGGNRVVVHTGDGSIIVDKS